MHPRPDGGKLKASAAKETAIPDMRDGAGTSWKRRNACACEVGRALSLPAVEAESRLTASIFNPLAYNAVSVTRQQRVRQLSPQGALIPVLSGAEACAVWGKTRPASSGPDANAHKPTCVLVRSSSIGLAGWPTRRC